jgi:hypothetical protein
MLSAVEAWDLASNPREGKADNPFLRPWQEEPPLVKKQRPADQPSLVAAAADTAGTIKKLKILYSVNDSLS